VKNLEAALRRPASAAIRKPTRTPGGSERAAATALPSAWRDTGFDHATVAKISARRQGTPRVACQTCHANGVDAPLGRECAICHADDPHRGQPALAAIAATGQSAWPAQIRFDHGLIAFPLLGKARGARVQGVSCERGVFTMPARSAPIATCLDPHAGRSPPSARPVTTRRPGARVTFDHAKQTAFALHGTHAKVQCAACTVGRPRSSPQPPPAATGAACHRQDDPHAGRFGTNLRHLPQHLVVGELRGR